MRKIGIGTAILVSLLLTIPLAALLYLGRMLLGLPFVPEDLYGWFVRAGVRPFVLLYDWFVGSGTAATQSNHPAVFILSIALFLIIGLLVAILFHLLVGRKSSVLDWVDGVAIGALFGVPLILVSLNLGSSILNPLVQSAWLAVLFIGWGVALVWVYRRLGQIKEQELATAAAPPLSLNDEAESGEAITVDPAQSETGKATIGRRQFLLRLGASTAAITAVSAVAATVFGSPERTAAQRRTLPVADPDTVAFYNDTFRRFSIISLQPGAAEGEVNVLALGAEYPDHHYVTVWIGEQSPIVIYENIETALNAYREMAGDAASTVDILWLDS